MIHPAANEAALRHLNAQLARVNLDLAVALGNLAWQNVLLAERDAEIAELKRAKKPNERILRTKRT